MDWNADHAGFHRRLRRASLYRGLIICIHSRCPHQEAVLAQFEKSKVTAEPTRRRLGLALLPIVIFSGLALVFWKGLSAILESSISPDRQACAGIFLSALEGSNIPGLTSADLKPVASPW